MPQITIVYWRDIPAQIIVGQGRRSVRQVLPERFEQAIDRCAMRTGAHDSEAYLAGWRKAPAYHADGAEAALAAEAVAAIEQELDPARLRALVDNDGRA